MGDISAAEIKKLREETGAGVMDVRTALVKSGGDITKAKDILKERGLEKATSKAERETSQGVIETYIHSGGKIGAMVFLACETDFVARTDEFKNLAKEISMQVASMNPTEIEDLLTQEYIRDTAKTIKELISEVVAKTGENIQIKKFARFSLSD